MNSHPALFEPHVQIAINVIVLSCSRPDWHINDECLPTSASKYGNAEKVLVSGMHWEPSVLALLSSHPALFEPHVQIAINVIVLSCSRPYYLVNDGSLPTSASK